jgi:ABC-type multidrug transport system ATPase subunit
LSPGCTFKGEIRVNDKKLRPNDFGKFGAFVQQDDILLETFTPEESFRFAAKLRTNLSDYEIEDKIDDIVRRLSL